MAYQKTNWVDGVTKVDATRMNNIENGIANIQCGEESFTDNSSWNTISITFPVSYNEIPVVVASLKKSSQSSVNLTIKEITKTGAQILINTGGSGTGEITWIAMGK